mgnify:CR=1 FL=1
MRSILVTLIVVLGSSFMLQEEASLERAIGYYQQLKFEKSLEMFDELVMTAPDDLSLRGRRGFVCYKYIQAVDTRQVGNISSERYSEVVRDGIEDLNASLAKYPGNQDNTTALRYLQARI